MKSSLNFIQCHWLYFLFCISKRRLTKCKLNSSESPWMKNAGYWENIVLALACIRASVWHVSTFMRLYDWEPEQIRKGNVCASKPSSGLIQNFYLFPGFGAFITLTCLKSSIIRKVFSTTSSLPATAAYTTHGETEVDMDSKEFVQNLETYSRYQPCPVSIGKLIII